MANQVTGANLGMRYGFDPRSNDWNPPYNEDFRKLDAVVMLSVLGIGTETPPGAPTLGARYILGPAPSGAWDGQGGRLAVWSKPTAAGAAEWTFYVVATGWVADNQADGSLYRYTGAAWVAIGGAAADRTLKAYTCTATETAGKVVYPSDAGEVAVADATDLASSRVIGWVTAKNGDTNCTVALAGSAPGSGLTPGDPVYLDPTTPGGITQTRPDVGAGEVVVCLGIADTATTYVWQPRLEEVP